MKQFRRRTVLRFVCLGSLALAASACGSMGGGASSAVDEQHPLLGASAPSFELPTPNAKQKITLGSYAGKVVVVDFWATWCQPCHDSFPAYQRISEKFGSKVAIIGISVDDDPKGIPRFAQETGAKFPLAWDDGQVVSKSYQPPTMPTSYIVDASGIVRFVHSGFRAGEEQEIESEISSLLK